MIKILHLAHAFFPDRSGTSERIFFSQPTDGFQHIILKPGKENGSYKHEKFIVHTFKMIHKNKTRKNTVSNAKNISAIALNLINKYNVDILYGHNPLLFSLATLLVKTKKPEIPLVYEPHNLLYSHYLKRINEKHIFVPTYILKQYHSNLINIEKELFKRSSFIIAQTEALGEEIKNIYNVKSNKIKIAYNGIPEIRIERDSKEIIKKYNLPQNKFIVYGGDLSENNGLGIILNLVKENTDLNFVIAGRGKFEMELIEQSKKCNNLFFLGKLQKKDYLEVLSVSDTLLILRKKDLTNNIYLPLKVLDAMLFNKKVLTTNLSIMEELSNSYSNIFFTKLHFDELNTKLKIVVNKGNLNNKSLNKVLKLLSWDITKSVIANAFTKTIEIKAKDYV
jgi:glycosyltransferase involved in cell wall biosynthesis